MSAISLLTKGMSHPSSTRFSQKADGRAVAASTVKIFGAPPRQNSSYPSNCDHRALQTKNNQGGDARRSPNAIPTSIWSARHDGSTAFIGDRGSNFNDAQGDPSGAEWFHAVHPDDLPPTLARWSAALRTGQPFHDVHRARQRGGQYERFLVDGVAIRDEDGAILCWIGAKTAIGDPELDYAEPRRNDPDFVGPNNLERRPDESRLGVNQAAIRRASSVPSDCIGVGANLGRRRDDLSPAAGAAPRLPPAFEPNSAVGKSLLEIVSAAAEAALFDSPQCLDPKLLRDSGVKALLQDLPSVERIPAELARLYSHALCVAVIARIGSGRLIGRTRPQRRRIAPLPKWRLARVIQYIGEHIEEPIRLANLAKAAGLTRMHFAAQFRATVGMSPHEYLMRRRISCAQTLLQDPRQRLVDVALSVGFQAQPHFTTVFRRYVGESPHRWRLSQGVNSDEESLQPLAGPEFAPRNLPEDREALR